MTKLRPALDLDLIIECNGQCTSIQGSGHRFVATFTTLGSLIYFARTIWPLRKLLPKGYAVQAQWKGLRSPFFRS